MAKTIKKTLFSKRPKTVKAKNMYVRFIPWMKKWADFCDIKNVHGVITEASFLKSSKSLNKKELKIVTDTFKWFNEHIPCPAWIVLRAKYGNDTYSWWKLSAREPINKLKPLIGVVRDFSLVKTLYSKQPGKIVYEDEFQVVAIHK